MRISVLFAKRYKKFLANMQFLNSSVQATLPRIFPSLQFTIVTRNPVFRRGDPSFEELKNTFKQRLFKIGKIQNRRSRVFEKIYAKNTEEEWKKNPRVIHVTSICPTFENPSTKRSERGRGTGGFSKARM